MDLQTLVEAYGPAGAIIFGLGWYALAERGERKEAQQSEKETLKLVFPAMAALEAARLAIERARIQ
jgi:hypothetical protein